MQCSGFLKLKYQAIPFLFFCICLFLSSNSANVPEAKEAMDHMKMEVACEIGVPLSNGYNGNLTSAQNGSVGGYMVKKMIEAQERQMAGK